jgi:uncharacterized protein YndB with AHSA1/START domain
MAGKAAIVGHTITHSIRIDAPRSEVWHAITDPSIIARWFGDAATYTALEVGATGVFSWDGHGDFPFAITGIEPESVFEYRWAGKPATELRDDDSTVVRMTLEAADDNSTILSLVESGFDSIAGGTAYRRHRLEENRDGWNEELDDLTALLETA